MSMLLDVRYCQDVHIMGLEEVILDRVRRLPPGEAGGGVAVRECIARQSYGTPGAISRSKPGNALDKGKPGQVCGSMGWKE
jgi:hypothetical protein